MFNDKLIESLLTEKLNRDTSQVHVLQKLFITCKHENDLNQHSVIIKAVSFTVISVFVNASLTTHSIVIEIALSVLSVIIYVSFSIHSVSIQIVAFAEPSVFIQARSFTL